MKGDRSDFAANGLPNGARSLKVGNAAGDWNVFTGVNYTGIEGYVTQGSNYRNPQEMGLPRDQAVMSLKRHGS